jgi:hypothetical protein
LRQSTFKILVDLEQRNYNPPSHAKTIDAVDRTDFLMRRLCGDYGWVSSPIWRRPPAGPFANEIIDEWDTKDDLKEIGIIIEKHPHVFDESHDFTVLSLVKSVSGCPTRT